MTLFDLYLALFSTLDYTYGNTFYFDDKEIIFFKNIMGASKRLCEMVVQAFDRKIKENRQNEIPRMFTHLEEEGSVSYNCVPENVKTEFVAVRFGNVLGSNGKA